MSERSPDLFPLARLHFASSPTIARRKRKELEYICSLDRRLLPLARLATGVSRRPAVIDLPKATGIFIPTAECSIATSLPNGAPPPDRDPGAQTVAGRETKSKQDSYVRQHRMFPQAIPGPLASVVPSQPISIPIFRPATRRRRPAGRRLNGQSLPH
jgi:hypothetical protein